MSILNKKSYPVLQDGKYSIKILEVEELKGKDDKEDFIQAKFLFENGRISTVSYFGPGIDIFFSQLRKQLNLPENAVLDYSEILENAENKILDLWIAHNVGVDKNGEIQNYTNYYLAEPKASKKTEAKEILK